MFRLEFEAGNFDSEGNRVIPLKQWMEEPSTVENSTDDLTTEEWMRLFNSGNS